MKKQIIKFSIVIISISILIIGFTIYAYWKNDFFNSNYNLNTEKLGNFGGFVGGLLGTLLTIVATILIYITYQSQKEELILNRQLIVQQQFESTFFSMLNVHRELKNNLNISKDDLFIEEIAIVPIEKYSGLDVLKKITEEYKLIYNSLDSLGIYDKIRLDKISEYISSERQNFSPNFKELEEDETNSKPEDLSELLDGKWDENNNKLETHKAKINFTYNLLFLNYQNTLSHYCRNVYHILKFIRKNEENDYLIKEKKHYKQYANIFQSQLNVNEQFVLFYNFIHFENNDEENEIYYPINIVNHYHFLENIGIDNLILNNHKKQYEFLIKGDN